ncbi:VPLPA-CTERM sorting domain-containing protein [Thermosulfurimonas dismutans]|uniref:VPLPA-CTERM sorting domain-containing protein n=1 Tax=Thermosulfurimonas dismutans TaxID=999894 RepID=UPI0008391CCE|nr:VPLPA-CTERM sorting domain-containing protein [Thermosulfurimonas dismutans]
MKNQKVGFLGVVLLMLFVLTAGHVWASTLISLISPFYVQFIDGDDEDSVVSFNAHFVNTDNNTTYWVGIGSLDHKWKSDGIEVGPNSDLLKYNLTLDPPGTYDVYVAWDTGTDGKPDKYIWTSEAGVASASTSGSTLSIIWDDPIHFSSFEYTFNGDGFNVISAVPLPAAVWLFGSGILGAGLLRRKLLA